MKDILINDITLRDGEQAAGVNFFPQEKLKIARQLVRLGVPIIEAGFPVASEEDALGVKLVAKEFGNKVIISAMCRASKLDIDIANSSLGKAKLGRIQVVMGTSDIHLKHKFNMGRDAALDLSANMVKYAKSLRDDVEFAAEDATRSDPNYLVKVCLACVEAGAKTIELPDTVGYATHEDYFNMVKQVVNALPSNIVVSTHCHNDLGLAVSNTLAGIMAGAKQAEVTINGIGERVGNASSEEVIMALKMRQDIFKKDISYIDTRRIISVSRLVESLSGIKVAYNKAITGRNAFLHESGIHQDGMIKSPQVYQLIDPKDIGLKGFQFVIGKLSGKHALQHRLDQLGIKASKERMKEFSEFFKKHAAKKKFILDDDIVTLYKKWKKAQI